MFSDKAIRSLMESIKKFRSELEMENQIVIKAIPSKKEWTDMRIALDKKAKKAMELVEEVEADKKKMWATIELGMDDFTTDKRLNSDTNEVEIMGDRNQQSGIKSPYVNVKL